MSEGETFCSEERNVLKLVTSTMKIFTHKPVKIGLIILGSVWLLGMVFGLWLVLVLPKSQGNYEDAELATPVMVMAVGDVNCDVNSPEMKLENQCKMSEVAALIKSKNPDAILMLGDLQYVDGSYDKFQNSFDKVWGDQKSKMYPAPGNHEYVTKDAAGYYEYFSTGTPVDVSKGYYKFNLGGEYKSDNWSWDLYSLNSNCTATQQCSLEGEQPKWLTEQLSLSQNKCQLTYWHHPLFTSGNYFDAPAQKKPSENLRKLLDDQKVELALNGHDHLYERFAPQSSTGVVGQDQPKQFTSGLGGKIIYPIKGKDKSSEFTYNEKYGALELLLYPGYYEWNYWTVDNELVDSGKAQCW
jgi:acid phosphatase type 7